MSKTRTPKYRVTVTTNHSYLTPMAWKGAPTKSRLVAWIATYNASFQPGGVNAGSAINGVALQITNATIVRQSDNVVMAMAA